MDETIISIAAGKTKTKETPKKDKQLKAKLMEDICFLLSGENDCVPSILGRWPYKMIAVKQILSDDPLILKVDQDNVAHVHSVDAIAGELFKHLRLMQPLSSGFPYAFPIKECLEAVKTWRLSVKTTSDMPKSFATRNDPSICFFRSQYEPDMSVTDLDTLAWMAPTWHSILGRLTNSLSFAKAVGRIYDLEASRKEAVWMVGKPNSGKSQILWFISTLVGSEAPNHGAHHYVDADDLSTKWWKANTVGKRIISTLEARYEFLGTEQFKSLTGDNMMSVEAKGVQARTVKNELLFFFYSNDKPKIPGKAATRIRVIMCTISMFKGPKLDEAPFRRLLCSEAEAFLGYCRNVWDASRGNIVSDTTELDEVIAENEDVFVSVFNKHFVVDPKASVRCDIVREKIAYSKPSDMTIPAFTNHWSREFDIKYERRKEGLHNSRSTDERQYVGYYTGLRLKTFSE
jgi:energy-coupling factor transporter ATP-binding protein EcfA2